MSSERHDVLTRREGSLARVGALAVVGLLAFGCAQQPGANPTGTAPASGVPTPSVASKPPGDDFTGPIPTVPDLPLPSGPNP
jgi:hypothetical protein